MGGAVAVGAFELQRNAVNVDLTKAGTLKRRQGSEQVLPVPGRWAHLATTYDRRVQRVYVNGVLVAVRPLPRAEMGEPGALHVGGNPVWGHRFKGKIDEVRVHNRALTRGEIRIDMTRPVACALPPLCTR
jgi:hypothetical protein